MSDKQEGIKRIGIIGTNKWESKRKIKQTIFKLKNKFDNQLQIVTTGSNDCDKLVKKYCLELECSYKEYNAAFTNYNLYSAHNPAYYGKRYHIKYIFQRNAIYSNSIDYLIAFVEESHNLDKFQVDIINRVKKQNKNIVLIS